MGTSQPCISTTVHSQKVSCSNYANCCRLFLKQTKNKVMETSQDLEFMVYQINSTSDGKDSFCCVLAQQDEKCWKHCDCHRAVHDLHSYLFLLLKPSNLSLSIPSLFKMHLTVFEYITVVHFSFNTIRALI